MARKALGALLLLAGLALFCYPLVSQLYNDRVMYSAVSNYDSSLSTLSDEALKAQVELARSYNEKLRQGGVRIADPFSEEMEKALAAIPEGDYPELLKTNQVIGSIKIPKIDQDLPVFNGVNDHILSNGAGYMSNTSIPIGGIGTHSVITGHRGLPTKEFFRHLDRLEQGDVFYVSCLGVKTAYEVDQKIIVEPSDTSALKIEPDKAYCTLITCEPYMVNSHRMLVRGHQIPYEEAKTAERLTLATNHVTFLDKHLFEIVAAGILFVFVSTLAIAKGVGHRARRKAEANASQGRHFK